MSKKQSTDVERRSRFAHIRDSIMPTILLCSLPVVLVVSYKLLDAFLPFEDYGFDRGRQVMSLAITITGGLLVFFAFVISWQRTRAAQKSADAALANAEAIRDGQITDRFSRAVEHLADERIDVRLGGIFELERIAHESKRDHWPVMEVLAAHVRRRVGFSTELFKKSYSESQQKVLETSRKLQKYRLSKARKPNPDVGWTLPEDVIAIVKVISNRNVEHETDRQFIDFSRICLAGLDAQGLNLERVDFSGSILFGAKLSWCKIRLSKFEDADLTGIDFTVAEFDQAKFIRAKLSGAIFRNINTKDFSEGETSPDSALKGMSEMKSCDLDKADFRGADLTGFMGIKRKEFEKAITDEKTKLGTHPPTFSD